MAYGFARALGRPAVVTATEGPGVTNLATGIAAAYKGYVPVISISGAQERVRERDASQDIDQVTFNAPITKWAYSIPTADKVQEAVRRAFRVALTEPLGPGAPRRVARRPARAGRTGGDGAGGLSPHRAAGVHAGRARRAADLLALPSGPLSSSAAV